MKKNQQDFTEIKALASSSVGVQTLQVYYQEITVSNFDSIKRLKEVPVAFAVPSGVPGLCGDQEERER